MANWLEKRPNLPDIVRKTGNFLSSPPKNGVPQPPKPLPNATIVYGIGASLLFAASVVLALSGKWLSAFTIFVIGVCLLGFALHLLKHQD